MILFIISLNWLICLKMDWYQSKNSFAFTLNLALKYEKCHFLKY